LRLFGADSGRPLGDEQLVLLRDVGETLVFDGLAERPVLSINRGFSAPVVVESDRSPADLAFLAAHDDDPFARYEAAQQLMLDTLIAGAIEGRADHATVVGAIAGTLDACQGSGALDRAFVAEAVMLPSEAFVGDQLARIDPEAIHAAREALRRDLGRALDARWRAAYDDRPAVPYAYTPAEKGKRRLRNVALSYVAASGAGDAATLAFAQFEAADNMTDRQAALTTLVGIDCEEREAALDIFYNRYAGDPLVIDKWFQTQALSPRPDTADVVAALARHPDFSLANPNRARALVGAFGVNQRAFHRADGAGYVFLADQLIALDRLNPQTAAKLLPPLGRWRRLDETRATMMRTQLERILATPNLSRDLSEQASRSLEA
jgi:aminopeptidase N